MADTYHINPKGYRRNSRTGKFEHIEVWERHHGRPVPDGHQIHHIDGDKLNNDPSNLLAVTPTEHKRIHSGCKLVDGIWWKPCSICHELKPIDVKHWYISKEGWPLYGRCRRCHVDKVLERGRRLREVRNAGQTA